MTRDRLFWAACALGGALVVAGCVLPTIEVGQTAYISGTDRDFDYAKTVRFATYGQPGALLYLIGGAGLVTLSGVAILRTGQPQPLLILTATALSIAFVAATIRISDDLRAVWDDVGVFACGEPLEDCVPFIAPAMRDLNTEIRTTPEAQHPNFEPPDDFSYRARAKNGWSLIVWTSIGLAAVTLYGAFLLGVRPIWAAVAVAAIALITIAYLFLEGLSGVS